MLVRRRDFVADHSPRTRDSGVGGSPPSSASESMSSVTLAARARKRDTPASKHGHVVGDRQCLSQLVGDQDDGVSRVGEPANPTKQLLDLVRCEDGRWLVENENSGVAREGLDDLEALLRADAELSGASLSVEREARPLSDLG